METVSKRYDPKETDVCNLMTEADSLVVTYRANAFYHALGTKFYAVSFTRSDTLIGRHSL